MIIETFVKGPIEDNNYLLIDESSKEAVLIDCTEPADDIIQKINQYNANLKYILLTHGHFDHILGVNYFKEKTIAKALIHNQDKTLLENINSFMRQFSMPAVEIQKVDELIDNNQILHLNDTEIKVIHTPGHTKGSVCYLIEDKLFSGDTIFYESVGRTDLDGGSSEELKQSIENRIFTLPDNIEIFPGHGCKTSVGHEKLNNKFL